jgi:hypothetical protein
LPAAARLEGVEGQGGGGCYWGEGLKGEFG